MTETEVRTETNPENDDFKETVSEKIVEIEQSNETPTSTNEKPISDSDITNDATNNEMNEDEQSSSKPNRELKQLLALSKEAKLDTNISHKRKSMDVVKTLSSTDQLTKKTKMDKNDFFPVTAESELEILNRSQKETKKDDKKEVDDKPIAKQNLKLFKANKDVFCWRCHRDSVNISCETCPRSYHLKCLKQTSIPDMDNWPCPECVLILKAESTQTRTTAMKEMTLEHLCSLLKFAVKRMIECNGSEPFLHPVDEQHFPDYKKYIVQPMTLTLLDKNIKDNVYGSPQAFEADAKWILHNSIIFNSYQSKLTSSAKLIMKICKQEMAEIEKCPTCYLNANTKKSTWFVEVCPKPHILVWAKLKGFPYWPAKVMCTNSSGMVDVRFFGAHDRAWIPSKECFLYSRKDPNSNKQKRNDIVECMKEVDVYISNIKAIYGEFNYAPFKHQYDPDNELQQLLLFIPRYLTLTNKRSRRLSNSRGKTPRKDDLDISENMEGYGTDDESTEIEALNTKKRAMMLLGNSESPSKQNDSDSDEQIESETDDDTQISTSGNIIKVKIRPRNKSKLRTYGRMEQNPDESLKLSRRSSEQSDSSRLSEKINQVDIPENVELTLGNSQSIQKDGDTKKNPIQIVDIENSELTISPSKSSSPTSSSTPRMSEKLIRKLSTTNEENVKSETDIILEKYKNLIKEKLEVSTMSSTTEPAETVEKKTEEIDNNEENVISSTETVREKEKEKEKAAVKVPTKDEKKKSVTSNQTPKKKGEITFRLILPKNSDSTSPYTKRKEENLPTTSKEENENSKKEEENTPKRVIKGTSPASHRIKVIKTTTTNNEEKKETTPNKISPEITADSNSSEDQEIDETMVQNMIKSSLNEEIERSKKRLPQPPSTADDEKEKNAKKIKIDTTKEISKENFKIVPIQTILNKKIDNVISNNAILMKKLTDEKYVSEKEKNKKNGGGNDGAGAKQPVGGNTEPMDLVTVEIKSEPESDEETEYMEKKRKYLSALNISEKTTDQDVQQPKKHEIRTRSKTEEIGRGKSDNISKVIDEVATSFSARHESKKTDKKANLQTNGDEKARSSDNGEIYVKSFAKIPTQQQQTRPIQQRIVQKSRTYQLKSPQISQQKTNATDLVPTTTLTRITPPVSTTTTTTVSQCQTAATSVSKSMEQHQQQHQQTQQQPTIGSSGNVLILTQPGVILPTSQPLAYNAGSFVTFVPSQQNVAVMPTSQVINAVVAPGLQQNDNGASQMSRSNVEIHRSQNYIPQNGAIRRRKPTNSNETTTSTSNTPNTSTVIDHTGEVPALVPLANENSPSTNTNEPMETNNEDEFSLLHSLVPETVSRAISEVLCRPLPKLKPRPPGPLSQVFDSGTPSAAGPISARINSISHKLGDYFRGMLIEMLEDLGKSSNSEATITALKQEIESLKHKHDSEMMDIRKNVCTILKDIQGSIAEERERIIDETRSACEIEALRRIEEAKSKQWCANCGKEAQFYCCWNTSYCDYPCQQKHWSKHMSKCTQNSGQNQQVQTPPIRTPGQITFKSATPKTFTGRILTKPTKVYLNRAMGQKNGSNFKATQGHLALVDTSNLEFITNTSGTKIMASTSLLTRVKTVNSTVTSPSNGTQTTTQQPQKNIQKVNNNPSNQMNKSRNSDSPNIISDEESE